MPLHKSQHSVFWLPAAMLVAALWLAACKHELDIAQVANDPKRYTGRRVRWQGHLFVAAEAGKTEPLWLVVEPEYHANLKLDQPLTQALKQEDTVWFTGEIEPGVSKFSAHSSGGSALGGAIIVSLKNGTVELAATPRHSP